MGEEIRKQFGKSVLDPTKDLTPSQGATLARALEESFGTPAEPHVALPDWDEIVRQAVVRPDSSKGAFANLGAFASALQGWKPDAAKKDWTNANAVKAELHLDDATLARGSVVYRRWCMQCHGPNGAGDGAQAIPLAAMPRDFRQGLFKFVTAFVPPPPPGQSQKKKGQGPNGKPLRDDLKRTVRNGLEGSMMPPFVALSERDLDDVVSYVIHLAIRGESEFATLAQILNENSDDFGSEGMALQWIFTQNVMFVLENWGIAARHPIPIPPPHTQSDDDRLISALRGFKLYNSAEFGCAACHVKFGSEPQLKWDLWGTVVQPRNLPLGVYRGGRRGEDLYARIYGGIHPSGMTAFQNTLSTGPTYPDRPDKIWNVVHFLQALADPYGRQRLQDPTLLAKFKAQLKEQGDFFLDDLNVVKIEP
jgi:mono/diheme cytochrome c family protein